MKKTDFEPSSQRAASCAAGRPAVAIVAALLAACSSPPPTHFHTLMPDATAATAAGGAAVTPLDWELAPVVVTPQVDQPQWVVRAADGTLVVLESERWIAPLADEIRGAVAERLTRSFGPPRTRPLPPSTPAWRIGVDVQRFELIAMREARLEANWTLRGEKVALTCHTALSQPAAQADYLALARAQRQSVQQLADAIAAALEKASKGVAVAC